MRTTGQKISLLFKTKTSCLHPYRNAVKGAWNGAVLLRQLEMSTLGKLYMHFIYIYWLNIELVYVFSDHGLDHFSQEAVHRGSLKFGFAGKKHLWIR